MQTLEAILAFAITMLILAMIASSMTEMVHRALGLRAKGLRLMLDRLYDDALAKVLPPPLKAIVDQSPGSAEAKAVAAFRDLGPRALSALARVDLSSPGTLDLAKVKTALLSGAADDHAAAEIRAAIDQKTANLDKVRDALVPFLVKNQVIEAMTENRVWAPIENARHGLFEWIASRLSFGTKVGKLTPEEFLQRLSSGSLGAHVETYVASLVGSVANSLNGARNAFFDDLSRRFESYGSEVALWFQARAVVTSALAGLVLAFTVHVDAFVLIRTFSGNQEVTRAVIAKWEREQARFEQELSRPPAPGEPATPEALRQDLDKRLDAARKETADLVRLGVPLGWRTDPISAKNATEPNGALWFEVPGVGAVYRPASLAVWLGLIVGGLMIGLGAPFWYDLVKNLSNVRRLVGAVDDMMSGRKPGQSQPPAGSRSGSGGGASPPPPPPPGGSTPEGGDRAPPPPPADPPLSEAAALSVRSRANRTERWGGRDPRTGGSF